MRAWYQERLDLADTSQEWVAMQQFLFRNVKVPVKGDLWKNLDPGAPQPGAQQQSQTMVASKEYVAHQVRDVIV